MKEKILNNWQIITIIILTSLVVWPLFMPGFFPHHDSLQIMRIFEMRSCLEDFQIPCRWVPDMGAGYGFPLFNYYGVLPYYIGAFLSYFLGFIGAAKALFFIPLVLGGLSMYFLGRELFGKNIGMVSTVLFMFAPYRALDSYVRGAITESFAISIIPIVFYLVLREIKHHSPSNLIFIALTLASFLVTHNIMAMFFIPILIIWTTYWLVVYGKKNLIVVLIGLFIGFGLSAFFLVPAFFETSLVQIDNLKGVQQGEFVPNFRAHFATLNQLFINRFWGYGASTWLEGDTISFQIGWPHWWVVAAAVFVLIIQFVKILLNEGKNLTKEYSFHLFGLLIIFIFLFSIFMTHNKSTFIWEKIEILHFTQFPWRFLSVAIFTSSIIGGLLVNIVEKKIRLITGIIIVLLSLIFNLQYFKPEKFDYTFSEQNIFSGDVWESQKKATIFDYLPKYANVPEKLAPVQPIVQSGNAQVFEFTKTSNKWRFKSVVKESSMIEVPIFDFPEWKIKINGKGYNHLRSEYLGTIILNLSPGIYEIEGELGNTLIRTSSNIISLISLLLLILIYAKVFKFR